MPYFFSLSLDEVTAIDNTSWVCMSIYMVNGHIRHSYLDSKNEEEFYNWKYL